MSTPSHLNLALAAAHGITDRLIATWNPELPRDPRVLVPILVEALVVRQEGGEWADTRMQQTPDSGDSVAAESLLPKPFALSTQPRAKGVYLHWSLPDALTHGTQNPDTPDAGGISNADAVFPAVPDRWLVVRLSPSLTHPDRRAVRGWILQAHDKDATRHDLDGWKDPGKPPDGLQKALTALGWGDISWAGYFDNTENRLGMYDDLSGVKQGPLAYLVCGWYSDPALDPLGPANVQSLTQFNAAMQKLGWALPDVDLQQPKASSGNTVAAARMVGLPVSRIRTATQLNNFVTPTVSSSEPTSGGLAGFDPTSGTYFTDGSWWPQLCLLHGAVVGIGWPGIGWEGNPTGVWNPKTLDTSIGQEEPGGPPHPAGIRVALGNTVTEAMARLVATGENRPDETRILEAFQLNALSILNDADGPARVDDLLHAREFGSVPGEPYTETIWQPPTSVNQPPPADPPKPGAGTFSRYKDAPGKIITGLGTISTVGAVQKSVLNTSAAVSPQTFHESSVLKGGLASVISKLGLYDPPPPPQPGKWISVQRTGPRLFHPTDPVLLIAGGKASFKHKPGSQSKDGLLYCRLTDDYADELSSPAVNIPGITPQRPYVRGADLLERGIENGSVPPDCTGLLNELAVLDPGSSLHAARSYAGSAKFDATQTAAVARSFLVEQTVWHATRDPRVDHGPLIAKSGIAGRLPSPISINLPARPWNPVRLDWSLDYIPSANGVGDWSLGEIDYQPQPVSLGTAISLSGSSILTQGANNIVASAITTALAQAASAGGSGIRQPGTLIKHFSAFAAQQVELFNKIVTVQAAQASGGNTGGNTGVPSVDRLPLDDIASALSDMDVLTGGLDGFTTQLRGGYRGDGTTVPPDGAPAPNPFLQLRSGFLRVTRLRLVDGFGQFIDLLQTNQQFQPSQIIKSDPMIVDGHDDLALLPPRFTSPARLLFEFVDAKDSGKRAITDPQGGNPISPICAYLMPNHLDGALEFFDVDGTNLGFVRPQDDATIMWEEAPGQPSTAGHDPALAIPNPHAGGIAKALVQWSIADAGVPGERDNALQAILRVIDSTLWSVDPFGHTGDEHLALLVGHPVAIVRARITLELREPIQSALVNSTIIPVRLGALAHWQDGLFGYFVNDDYTRLYCSDAAAAGLARAIGPGTGFLGPINTVPDQLTNFAADTGNTPVTHPYIDTGGIVMIRPNQTIDLTLLLEPHSVVHATTGLLPRKEIGLRRDWTDAALARLSPTFRFGPVLVDPQRIRMPIPVDLNGTWSWDHRADINTWAEDPVTNATQDALLPPDPPTGTEGWLRLSPPSPKQP